jgi:hypothetical protein
MFLKLYLSHALGHSQNSSKVSVLGGVYGGFGGVHHGEENFGGSQNPEMGARWQVVRDAKCG